MPRRPTTPPASFMMFISCDDQHFGQFVVPPDIAQSLQLTMERLSSWAIDERGFASCIVMPGSEDGDTYFELECVDQSGTSFTLLAACFRVTTN